MMVFQLVKNTLDDLYEQGRKHYKSQDELDKAIAEQIAYLSKAYEKLHDPKRRPVDYKDPATRFAYVYMYVAAHSDYVVQLMQNLRNDLGGTIFKSPHARATCIGGGPGSDIIAVLKYLDEYRTEPVKKLSCYLLDKEQAWADTWTELDERFNVGVQLSANFQPLDVTNPESWKYQRKFLDADLFTVSYFISEVYCFDQDGKVSEFWQTVFGNAKPGALFVYDDNCTGMFGDFFDKQWKNGSIECLRSGNNKRFTPRASEEASELGEYLSKFGKYTKLQGNISYRVLRKK